jgi:hypothetical protein
MSRTSAWNAQFFAFSRSGPIDALLQTWARPSAPSQCEKNRLIVAGEQSAPVATFHFCTNVSRWALPRGVLAIASRRHEFDATPLSRTSAWNAQFFAFSRSGPIDALLQTWAKPSAPSQCEKNRLIVACEQSAPVATRHRWTIASSSALPHLSIAVRAQVALMLLLGNLWTVLFHAQSAAFCRSLPFSALLQNSGFPSVPCQ